MFLELLATFVAGIAGAGLMLLLNRLLGGRLPRWMIPVAAGTAMLGMAISSEYGWYARTAQAMPPQFEVAETVVSKAVWRPWTYLAPFVERFVVVDRNSVISNAQRPEERMAMLVFYGRWSPVKQLQLQVNCATGERALPVDGGGGELRWQDVGTEDPLIRTICKGSGS